MSAPGDGAAPFPLAEYDLTPPHRWFALDHAGKNNATMGLSTSAGSFVARRYGSSSYADPAALDYEERLLASLNRRTLSLKIPLPRSTRQGTLHVGKGAERGALIPLLPGTPRRDTGFHARRTPGRDERGAANLAPRCRAFQGSLRIPRHPRSAGAAHARRIRRARDGGRGRVIAVVGRGARPACTSRIAATAATALLIEQAWKIVSAPTAAAPLAALVATP